ncbi:hypothetical protein [Catenulispora rubra]|uniref:hypothetical protein n=1 Tax=Catenulispora rubra TaxID=280293 RepID=UPI002B266C4E|nr:hypothetical protein [Catenulispora rubra]
MSPQASAVATARAIFSPAVEDAAKHLFNERTLDRYRHTMADGIDRVANRIAHTNSPFAEFRRFDLFAPDFALSCLNRLQLRNNQQMVDLNDPSGALQLVGTLENPVARFRRDPLDG